MEDYIQIKYETLKQPGVYDALNLVVQELAKAIDIHPDFPQFGDGQASIVMEEVGEWAAECIYIGNEKAKIEAAHACATLIRAIIAGNSGQRREPIADAMACLGEVARDINDHEDTAILMSDVIDAAISTLGVANA